MEKTAGEVFAQRMKEALQSRGMTKVDLSRKLKELGHPIDPVVLGRIAKGGTRAKNLTVEQLLAIAYALDAPPFQLIQPYDEETKVKIVGNRDAVTPDQLEAYLRGWTPLPGMDETTFMLELPPAQLVEIAGERRNKLYAALEGLIPPELLE